MDNMLFEIASHNKKPMKHQNSNSGHTGERPQHCHWATTTVKPQQIINLKCTTILVLLKKVGKSYTGRYKAMKDLNLLGSRQVSKPC